MKLLRSIGLFTALMLLLSSQLYALTLERGRLRLTLHEDSGRFTVSYRPDLETSRYVPLIYEDDPRTSGLLVLEDNVSHRMGEAAAFEQTVEETDNGGRFIWTSGTLRVEQDFAFTRSEGATLVDGVIVTLTLTNLSESPSDIGVRYLFDTYLAERSNVHFASPAEDRYFRETALTDVPYVYTPGRDDENVGLQIMLEGDGLTDPTRLVIANWLRLSDAGYSFTVNSNRNFNLLPYSINDSAAALFYDIRTVQPDEPRTIVTALGNYAPNGYSVQVATDDEGLGELFEATAGGRTDDEQTALREALLAIDDIIARIDRLIESGASQEQIEVLQNLLTQIRERYDLN